MSIPALVLPVFGVIVTGWAAGALAYVPRGLAGPLVQFAYTVAMPALVFGTLARQPLGTLLDWSFLAAFGGGSMICLAAFAFLARTVWRKSAGESVMAGTLASMTNTGFVALPILQALYGEAGVVPAAVATAFVGAVMFPLVVLLLEIVTRARVPGQGAMRVARQAVLNPVIVSTLSGLLWSAAGLPLPPPVAAYMESVGDALTPCALFAIGLGLSIRGLRDDFAASALITTMKLMVTPLVVLVLCAAVELDPVQTVAAVVCAAVPTAKTAYVLAGAYEVDERTAGAAVSMTMLFSMGSLLGWLWLLG